MNVRSGDVGKETARAVKSRSRRARNGNAGGDTPVTVRLSDELLRVLTGLSIVDDTTVAEQMRKAVISYWDERCKSPEFESQLSEAKSRQLEALNALLPGQAED